MKKYLNLFAKGSVFGLGVFVTVFLCMLIVKGAWQSSNPTAGLGDATNLYTSGEDTLTKEKWNALVEKVNNIETTSAGYDYDSGWFDVGTTSAGYGGATTNTVRNVYSKAHNLNSKNLDIKILFRTSSTDNGVYVLDNYMQFYVSPNRTCVGPYIEYLDNNSVKISVRYSGCSYHYVSTQLNSKTTGQYRLLVKKL